MWIQIASKLYNLNHYNCVKMCYFSDADKPFRVRIYHANSVGFETKYVEFYCDSKQDVIDLFNRIKKRTLGIVDLSKFDSSTKSDDWFL